MRHTIEGYKVTISRDKLLEIIRDAALKEVRAFREKQLAQWWVEGYERLPVDVQVVLVPAEDPRPKRPK